MNRLTIAAVIAIAAALPNTTHAAEFCARNSTELRNALTTAASNGQYDEIRIAQGTFYASSTAPFFHQSYEPHGLRISGGWVLIVGNCAFANRDATTTVLDGSGSTPALRVHNFSTLDVVPLTVEGLTLRNGRGNDASGEPASGLSVYGIAEGALQITVDRVIVLNNVSTKTLQPAVALVSDYEHIRFTNSIVRDNVTLNSAAVNVHSNHGGSLVNHVTVVDNVRGGDSGASVKFIGARHLAESSVFFGNTGGSGHDLDHGGDVWYRHVRYGLVPGELPNGNSNFVVADPLLDAALRPLPTSTLTNTGGWRMTRYDVYGVDGLMGGYSDIGAAERIEGGVGPEL